MWPTSNKSIHQKLMDQYDEKLPEMFADGSNVSNEEKAVLHMDLNYNLRIGFRKKWYPQGPSTLSLWNTVFDSETFQYRRSCLIYDLAFLIPQVGPPL